MANVVYELMAVLGLDSKPFEDGLNGAKETAEGGGSKISSALGGAAKAAGVALAAASTAVVAFGKSSIDAGKEFDSSMSQVYATMGNVDDMGADSFNKLKAAAQEMGVAFDETTTATELSREVLRAFAQEEGATTAFSATQAADALNYMALAGYDATTSMDMLPNVLNLAAAGDMALATASDMVTDAQSALGLSLEETSDMVDQMAKASSKSNTSVTQLGDAILTIGATARNVKGGTAELSTVLGVLADNGIKGSEGGTHLRNVIMSLQNPTKDGAAALEKLGVSVYDSDGNMRSLVDIISDLQTGLGNMDQASRDAMINGIFNKTDAAAVNALIGTSRERFDELTAAIIDSHGAAQAMADTQLDNLAGDITLFQSALEGAKIAISDSLTPTLREFVQFGTQAVSELGTAFREDGLEGAINALGPIIDRGVEMLFKVLPRILEAGVALLDALITAIITNLPKLVPAAVQIIKQLVDSISKNIETIMDAAVEIILALADGLIDVLPEMIPAIIEIITTIVDKLTEPDTLAKLIEASLQIIIALAEGLIEALPKLIEKAPEIVGNLFTALLEEGPKIIEAGIELIGKLAEGLIQAIPKVVEAIGQLAERIKQEYEARKDKLTEWGNNLIDNLITGIREKWEDFKQALEEAKEILSKYFGEIIEWFHQKGKEIGEIFTSIKTSFGLVRDWFRDKINDIKNKWTELKDNIHEKVENIKEFFGALKDAFGAVHDWFVEKIEGIKAGWQSLTERISQISDDIKAVCEAIQQAFSDAFDRVTKFIGEDVPNAFDAALEFFQGLPERALQWGADLIHGFVDGIKQKWSDLKGTLGDFGQTIADWIGFSEPRLGPLSHFHEFAPDMMELFAKGIKDNENLVTAQINKSFDFGGGIMGASPALAAGPTTNTWNITVNGIDELEEIVRWYQGRQVEGRMK